MKAKMALIVGLMCIATSNAAFAEMPESPSSCDLVATGISKQFAEQSITEREINKLRSHYREFTIQVTKPGAASSMDLRSNRLSISIRTDGTVESAWCG